MHSESLRSVRGGGGSAERITSRSRVRESVERVVHPGCARDRVSRRRLWRREWKWYRDCIFSRLPLAGEGGFFLWRRGLRIFAPGEGLRLAEIPVEFPGARLTG